jgi:ABC-2 type transport system ATP-binding protein
MIESMEENWDVTYIMMNGRVARVCRRAELSAGESLEGMYFAITEGAADAERAANAEKDAETRGKNL